MRVLTWLPRDLRQGLAALDPARGADAAPRPHAADLISRAAGDDGTVDTLDVASGDGPGSATHPKRHAALAVAAAVILIAAVAAGLASYLTTTQSAPPASDQSPLRDVTWMQPATQATVVFRATTAHLSDGCDGDTERLRVRAGRLHLGAQVGKGYVCSPVTGPVRGMPGYREYQRKQATLHRFYRVLHSSPTWSITRTTLTLTTQSGITVRLTDRGTAPLSLPGTRWDLDEVNSAALDEGTISGAYTGTLNFDNNGRFQATDPCEQIFGDATITGSHISFHITRDLPRHCPPITTNGMSATVHHELSGTATWQIEDNRLRLTAADRTDLVYTPAPH